jgi:hypothetical protein
MKSRLTALYHTLGLNSATLPVGSIKAQSRHGKALVYGIGQNPGHQREFNANYPHRAWDCTFFGHPIKVCSLQTVHNALKSLRITFFRHNDPDPTESRPILLRTHTASLPPYTLKKWLSVI